MRRSCVSPNKGGYEPSVKTLARSKVGGAGRPQPYLICNDPIGPAPPAMSFINATSLSVGICTMRFSGSGLLTISSRKNLGGHAVRSARSVTSSSATSESDGQRGGGQRCQRCKPYFWSQLSGCAPTHSCSFWTDASRYFEKGCCCWNGMEQLNEHKAQAFSARTQPKLSALEHTLTSLLPAPSTGAGPLPPWPRTPGKEK